MFWIYETQVYLLSKKSTGKFSCSFHFLEKFVCYQCFPWFWVESINETMWASVFMKRQSIPTLISLTNRGLSGYQKESAVYYTPACRYRLRHVSSPAPDTTLQRSVWPAIPAASIGMPSLSFLTLTNFIP